jgi:radical SAM-linked protein
MYESFEGDRYIEVPNETIGLAVKYRIEGGLRFLSHAQTLNLWQRACVRAGLEVQYTHGHNPRPRLSLPLPRPVGVVSDDELLYVRIRKDSGPRAEESTSKKVQNSISAQLPQGLQVYAADVVKANRPFQPCSATYILAVRSECIDEDLKATIKHLLSSENLAVRRRIIKKKSRIGARKPKIKDINARDFLESIELSPDGIIVKCKITQGGSIRIDEILGLLGLDVDNLVLPIRRTSVQWQQD